MTSKEIRQQFLDFFASKQHQIVPSAPIVVKNDPTLLFTNAGMNQFKDYFLGNKKAPHKRIADTQKCLRVSGKHNDLEEVGVDTYHHTMFEMLGNWSFGDYFKNEAIAWSWELLTEVYKLDKSRLYVTVFEGDDKEGLPKDEEALDAWRKYTEASHILYGNKKDNFWEMGDTGPCGPCTEIHFDSRSDEERKAIDGSALVNKDHPQVIEIWNNVFIQFNRLKNGNLELLPEKHVDTGMGLERLVRVLQQKKSNYDSDLFTDIISVTENITNEKYSNTDSRKDIAFRVLADHIRAISFTIADGQLPANTGAGYVIRRILRRAVRYYYSYLNYKSPLLFRLVEGLAEQFEGVFPELKAQQTFVEKVIKEEEEAFLRTLEKGLKKMDEILSDAKANQQPVNGKAAFELFDTYGFPIDLTRLIAQESGFEVDEAAFEHEMKQQKERSRAATTIDAGDWIVLDEYAMNEFVGYDSFETKSRVVKYRKIKQKNKEYFQIVLESTPFYAESGGQVGDTGTLTFDDEVIDVTDTRKENELIVHYTEKLPLAIERSLLARVDIAKRKATAVHHTATHLLHAALKNVLGAHVNQKGSLVTEGYLRFDFSHFSKVSAEDLLTIETLVNDKIRENIPVSIAEMNKDEAVAKGAMALFGEKYGEKVRVVTIDSQFSMELCGGTHVRNTGSLGFFKILSESSVAAGVRRIEAVCGKAAEKLVLQQFQALGFVKEMLKNPKDIVKSLQQILTENNELRKKIESLETLRLNEMEQKIAETSETINGVHFIGQVVEVSGMEMLKKLCFNLKRRNDNGVVVLAANVEGKAQVAVMVDEAVVSSRQIDATTIIKNQVAPVINGGGGGQKTLATAGGTNASNLPALIEAVRRIL